MSESLVTLAHQQKAIATISEWARSGRSFGAFANKAVSILGQQFEPSYCDIIEVAPDATHMRLLATSSRDYRGEAEDLQIEAGSEAAYSLLSAAPVILQDLRTEGRFHRPLLPYHRNVISGVSIRIAGRNGPCGILGVHSIELRRFTANEVNYLRVLANLFGVAAARQQAEQQLHVQSRILNVVEDAVIAVDLEGRIVYWNHSAELLYGWRSSEVYGAKLDDILPLAHESSTDSSWASRLNTGPSLVYELLVHRRSGIRLLVRVAVSPLRDEDGNPIGMATVHSDLVEQKWVAQAHRYAQEALEVRVAERTEELTKTNRRLQEEIGQRERFAAELAEMRRLLEVSREQERLRLARELHDGPLQDLMGANLELAAFAQSLHEEAKMAHIQAVRARQDRIARDLRAISQELRPPLLAHFGLAEAIRAHAGQLSLRAGLPALDLTHVHESPPLPEATTIALFRIYQQAIQNVVQHAQATQVAIRLHTSGEQLTLEVEDDGCGFTVPPHWVEMAREQHFGLIGISERAQGIAGRFDIRSALDEGTLVRVTVPLLSAS